MNKSAKSSKSPNKSKSSKSSKSPNKVNVDDAARVAEVAWGMAYMNEVWKQAYEKAGEEIKANRNKA
jgi:hypothetical protein